LLFSCVLEAYLLNFLCIQEYLDQYGDRENRDDDDDDMTGGGAWQSVQIDSRPVDITTLPEKSVLDEEPVLNHGLAGALQLATKKGMLKLLLPLVW